MNPGYIRFSVTTLVIVAFFLGCDSSGEKGEAAQDENIQNGRDLGPGNVDKNNPSEANQNTDGSGNNPSDGNQSTGNERDGSQDSGQDSKGDSGTDQADDGDVNEDVFSVGGTLSGLISSASLVLQNNGTDDLTVSQNGPFTFATKLADGAAYKVTILNQPEGQYCEVSKGEGRIDKADVTVIAVTCADPEEIDSGWARVSAGFNHACATRTDGQLFCWGSNQYGQLGNNSAERSPVPVQENTAANDWAQVSAGRSHTCAVKTDGRLFCWGNNEYGQLGNNSEENSPVPVQENTRASDWAQVSTGYSHTCAVKTDGRLFCWGIGSQLGNNSQLGSLVPIQEATFANDWAQVSAHEIQSCAVKTDGRLFCWGGTETNWMGRHFYSYQLVPAQETTRASDWAQVSTGYWHAYAVKTDGRLYKVVHRSASSGMPVASPWGEPWEETLDPVQEISGSVDWAQVSAGGYICAVKTDGQLLCARESNNSFDIELDDIDPQLAIADWAQVSAGYDFACAVKVDGQLFCWGGLNSPNSDVPVQEQSAAADWAQVSAQGRHTCAVKSDGRLFCWGDNDRGQLGNNSTTETKPLEPVQEDTAASDWAQVSAGGGEGGGHTCAVKSDGRLFCWGDNAFGMLGNNSIESSPVPVQENTTAVDWTQVSVGRYHTCAINSDGALFCWGGNYYGAFGNNTTENSRVPVQEATLASDWAQVASAENRTCAIKTDGRLFCWGANLDGEPGNTTFESLLVPVQEDTMAVDWTQVSTRVDRTCAVKSNGTLFCWGRNETGALGNGDAEDSLVPVQENTKANDWAQVSAGYSHTCAIKTDGRLFCWGANTYGKLGNPSTGSNPVPVQEETRANDWAQVTSAENHTCAIKTDGRLFCWGMDTINTFGPIRLTD